MGIFAVARKAEFSFREGTGAFVHGVRQVLPDLRPSCGSGC
jgi:hypothetical protein